MCIAKIKYFIEANGAGFCFAVIIISSGNPCYVRDDSIHKTRHLSGEPLNLGGQGTVFLLAKGGV